MEETRKTSGKKKMQNTIKLYRKWLKTIIRRCNEQFNFFKQVLVVSDCVLWKVDGLFDC